MFRCFYRTLANENLWKICTKKIKTKQHLQVKTQIMGNSIAQINK